MNHVLWVPAWLCALSCVPSQERLRCCIVLYSNLVLYSWRRIEKGTVFDTSGTPEEWTVTTIWGATHGVQLRRGLRIPQARRRFRRPHCEGCYAGGS